MIKTKVSKGRTDISEQTFSFESYGVFVQIKGNNPDIIAKAEDVVRTSLLNNIRIVETAEFDHVFELPRDESGTFFLIQNGETLSYTQSEANHYKFFDSILRVTIGEYAVDRVFMHAGVVGWDGKAIILPADSFQGKSTLVTELVKNGANYYSDEFAILDAEGLVHPFPRRIGRRTEEFVPYEVTIEELGGTFGKVPIPVGLVLLTGYEPEGVWEPEILTPGSGVLKMIPYALSIRYRTDFSMQVLHNIASRAIIASSRRGSAERFAKTLLDFVDKHVN
jgi:hypothetical protein